MVFIWIKISLTIKQRNSKTEVLKVWSSDLKHQHHLERDLMKQKHLGGSQQSVF